VNRLHNILPAVLVLALATLACGINLGNTNSGQSAAPQATQAVSEATKPAATEPTATAPAATEPAAAEPPATEPAAPPAQGSGEEAQLDLKSSVSSVQNLSSYRVGFRFDWKGTKAGQPIEGYIDMRSAFVREPAARELQLEAKGMDQASAQTPSKISFIQVGDTAWMYESQSNTWMQLPAGESSFAEGFFKPEDLMSSFDVNKGQRSLLPEDVNGVPCYKYTFSEGDFTANAGETVKNASGEAYIAVDGGYVVKMTINGDVSYTDQSQMFDEGTIKLVFDLSDINKPITIEPPAEAKAQAGGREDIPKMPDAKIELSTGELISYRTASSVKDVADFYETEMANNGWTAGENNKDLIMDESAILSYNKAGETANVIVSKDDKGTSVMISIGKE
jgi:hypothetical protein